MDKRKLCAVRINGMIPKDGQKDPRTDQSAQDDQHGPVACRSTLSMKLLLQRGPES